MNPEDVAAARYKEVRQAREQTAKTEAALEKATNRLEQLRSQLPRAEAGDRTALAEVLVDEKHEPASKAEGIRAEIERQEQRVEALRLAGGEARGQIPTLVSANRATWRRQAMRELDKAKNRYVLAITELEAAREELVDEATLITWIDRGEMGEAANPALSFPRSIEELRADVAHLAAHPDTRRSSPQSEPHTDIGRMRDGAAAASLWAGR
jgi:hypothetical protein